MKSLDMQALRSLLGCDQGRCWFSTAGTSSRLTELETVTRDLLRLLECSCGVPAQHERAAAETMARARQLLGKEHGQ